MLDVHTRDLFLMDYPAEEHFIHLLYADGVIPFLGDWVSCARDAPLGRAVIRLQRRARFRRTARRFLRRLLGQLPWSTDEIMRRIIGYSSGVTLFPRVM